MSVLFPEQEKLIGALLEEGVDLLVIGGYAVNFHGHHRNTGDLDLWVRPDEETQKALLRFFEKEGYEEEGLKKLRELDFTEAGAFHIGQEPDRIDLLTKIAGVDFEEAWSKREILRTGDLEVPFIHIEHLILSKMQGGRLQDKADVEELQRIRKERNG